VKQIGIFLEQAFVVLTLVIYSGGLLTLLVSGGAGEKDVEVTYDTSWVRIFYFVMYLITFLLLALRWRTVIDLINRDKYLWILVALPVISLLWSFDSETTLKDSVTLVGSSIFGLYFAIRYNIKQQLQLIAIACVVAIFLSTMFVIAIPKYGIMQDLHSGAWRGIHSHKNGLGQMMGLGTLVFIILGIDNKSRSYFSWIGLALSLTLLILSRSTASMTNTLIVIPFFWLLPILRLRYSLMIPAIISLLTIGLVSSILINDNLAILAGSVGKTVTLTGRTDVWQFVWEMIQKQPWLGYGYGGFWNGLDGESAYVWRATQWTPTHPHNGLLQLCLDLGLVGVGLYLIGFWKHVIRIFAYVRSTRDLSGIWPVVFLIYLLLLNLTETHLLSSNSIIWVLYVTCYCSMLRLPQPDRLPVQA
jgi:exopolysaccharide production protein ExoQ